MRILSLIAVVVFVSALAAPAQAGMAEDCNQARNWDQKIGGCTALIRSDQVQGENITKAYYLRGVAYLNVKEYRRAIEDFDHVLRLDPGHALAYRARGTAYAHLHDYRRAIRDYDQALRLDPGNAIAYGNRGATYAELGEYLRAIEDYDQALRLDPGYALARDNRRIALRHLGE